jgi:hypothetical protein
MDKISKNRFVKWVRSKHLDLGDMILSAHVGGIQCPCFREHEVGLNDSKADILFYFYHVVTHM